MNCPLCESKLSQKADELYYICSNCCAYVKDARFYPNPSDEKSRYDEHNNDVNDPAYQNFTSPITNAVLEMNKAEDLGLDYGCGNGPVITKMLEKNGYTVKLYDPYYFPDESCLQHKYDYIFSCEVFEHFYEPKKEIEKIIRLLKPNALLYVMTKIFNNVITFDNWYYRKDPTHVFIYTEKTINYISQHFNLAIEKFGKNFIIFRKTANPPL